VRSGGGVRGGVDDVLVVGQKIAACGAPFAGRHHVLIRAVRVHNVHLVALVGRPRGLEDQALAIGRPIGFGILAAVRQLADITEMRVAGKRQRGRHESEQRNSKPEHQTILYCRANRGVPSRFTWTFASWGGQFCPQPAFSRLGRLKGGCGQDWPPYGALSTLH